MPRIDGSRSAQELSPIEEAPVTGPAAEAAAPAAPPPAAARPGGPSRMDVLAGIAARAPAPPDPARVEADVDALYAAMKGLGTDEDRLFEILERRTPAEREAIQERFAAKYADDWKTLRIALRSELSGEDEKRALAALDRDIPVEQRKEILKDLDKGGGLGRLVRHFGTWFTFGLKSEAAENDGIPRLRGADIRRDLLPHLKPGDTILCGNAGGVSHAMVYVGNGKIIHSMASKETTRTVGERVMDTLRAPTDMVAETLGRRESKQGVILESVDQFFERFERDTYVVLRAPNLTPEKTQKGLEKIAGLLGKEYDWDFVPGNDAYYCTEVVSEFYRAALGDEAPRIGGRPVHVPLLLDREAVVDPLDVLASPDLAPVLYTASAETKFKERLAESRRAGGGS